MQRELEGQVAVVTGAAVGIGRAIAEDLASAGAVVILLDRADASDAVAAIRQGGGVALASRVDVTDEQAMRDAVDDAAERFGGIHLLINNAGVFASLMPRPFDEIPLDEWRTVMEVNVLGSFVAARAVVGHMRQGGGGRIVNIASTTAFKGVSHLLHYTSSKGAVLAMTKALARELGADDIHVNAVAPGFTVSDGVEANSAGVSAMRQNAPGGRVLQREMVPNDVVGAVRFLAGSGSAFVTGQTLVVDGGAYFH